MPEIIGKKIICPRCDAELFLKYLGTDELDGGFTSRAKFEDRPEEWTYISELGGTLCPDCSRSFKTFVKNFMGYGRGVAPVWSLDE